MPQRLRSQLHLLVPQSLRRQTRMYRAIRFRCCISCFLPLTQGQLLRPINAPRCVLCLALLLVKRGVNSIRFFDRIICVGGCLPHSSLSGFLYCLYSFPSIFPYILHIFCRMLFHEHIFTTYFGQDCDYARRCKFIIGLNCGEDPR